MKLLIDLPTLTNTKHKYTMSKNHIIIDTNRGGVTLDIISESSHGDLLWCKPTNKKWQTMFVLEPALHAGVEVFGVYKSDGVFKP